MGGIARCVSCGEVHWNLSFGSSRDAVQECRACGSELSAVRRPGSRRFERLVGERRDAKPAGPAAGLGGSATS